MNGQELADKCYDLAMSLGETPEQWRDNLECMGLKYRNTDGSRGNSLLDLSRIVFPNEALARFGWNGIDVQVSAYKSFDFATCASPKPTKMYDLYMGVLKLSKNN